MKRYLAEIYFVVLLFICILSNNLLEKHDEYLNKYGISASYNTVCANCNKEFNNNFCKYCKSQDIALVNESFCVKCDTHKEGKLL